MAIISEMKAIDIPKYHLIFTKVSELFGSVNGVYYKVNIDDKDYILHKSNNVLTLFSTGKEIHYKTFTIDKDYNINGLVLGRKEVYYVDNQLVSRDKLTGVLENVSLVKRDEPDYEGYNGYVLHVQYNPDQDVRLIQTFQHNYNADERIYDMHIQKPFNVIVEQNAAKVDAGLKKASRQVYIKDEYDIQDDPIGFSLATIKDFGITKFLQKGSFALQNKEQIVRYYKVLRVDSNGGAVTRFPLCRQYKQEDITEIIEEYGFNSHISELLLDIYNSDYPLLPFLRDVVASVKNVEMDKDSEIKGYKVA